MSWTELRMFDQKKSHTQAYVSIALLVFAALVRLLKPYNLFSQNLKWGLKTRFHASSARFLTWLAPKNSCSQSSAGSPGTFIVAMRHCLILRPALAIIVLFYIIYDICGSMFTEVCWLAVSLEWGTARSFPKLIWRIWGSRISGDHDSKPSRLLPDSTMAGRSNRYAEHHASRPRSIGRLVFPQLDH